MRTFYYVFKTTGFEVIRYTPLARKQTCFMLLKIKLVKKEEAASIYVFLELNKNGIHFLKESKIIENQVLQIQIS